MSLLARRMMSGATFEGGGGGGGGVPSTIANLVLWLDGDDIEGLSNTDPIDQWDDLSGEDHHATQTGSNRPTYRASFLNSKGVVRFDGENHNFEIPSGAVPSGNNPYTIIAVAQWSATGLMAIIGAGSVTSTGRQLFLRQQTSNRLNDGWYSSNLFSPNNAITTSTWHVVAARYDQAGRALYVDDLSTPVASDSSTSRNSDATPARVGSIGDGSSRLDGYIAELLVYQRALSGTEMGDLETYLNDKWGLGS